MNVLPTGVYICALGVYVMHREVRGWCQYPWTGVSDDCQSSWMLEVKSKIPSSKLCACVSLCVCVIHMYVCILGEGTWVCHGAHKNVRGQSLPLWDRSLVTKHSRLGGPSVPRSSVSTFHLAREHLGLQIHAAMPGFMWVLRNANSGSSACVAILYPMNHLILKSQSTVNKTSSQWLFLFLFFFFLFVCVVVSETELGAICMRHQYSTTEP